jgi:hypothetical protein
MLYYCPLSILLTQMFFHAISEHYLTRLVSMPLLDWQAEWLTQDVDFCPFADKAPLLKLMEKSLKSTRVNFVML